MMIKIIIILSIILIFLKIKINNEEREDVSIDIGDFQKFLFATTYTFSCIHKVMDEKNTLNSNFLNNSKSVKYAKKLLIDGYGISNKLDAIEGLEWLVNSGHRDSYEYQKDIFIENKYLEVEKRNVLIEINKKHKDIGILGWDLVRVNHVALYSYMCGYINKDELSHYCKLSCNTIYTTFNGWVDFIENVALGHKFFTINVMEQSEQLGKMLYEKHMNILADNLNKNGIYDAVKWELNL